MNKGYQVFMQRIINFLIIFACFSIALPTAWMSITYVLILISWTISGDYSEKFKRILNNPAAVSTLILVGLYGIGVIYSSGTPNQSTTFLMKYAKLLLIPIIISLVITKKIQRYSLNAFILGASLLLFISYFKWLNIIPIDLGLHDMPDNSQGYLAFKNRIAHNILMSFLMFVFFCKAKFEKTKLCWIWLTLALLTFFDLMFLVGGRSGQVIALSFFLFLPVYFYGKKAIKYFFFALVSILIFYPQLEHLIPQRLLNTTQEISEHKSNNQLTSAGIRLEMYKNTLHLIKQSPLFGYGTGALRNEYNKLAQTQDTLLKDVPNPHNQYLLTFFELGIIGFVAFIYMFYKQWSASNNLIDLQLGLYMKGLILTMLIGSLFNSLLLDATEGRFYCVLTGIFLSFTSKNE